MAVPGERNAGRRPIVGLDSKAWWIGQKTVANCVSPAVGRELPRIVRRTAASTPAARVKRSNEGVARCAADVGACGRVGGSSAWAGVVSTWPASDTASSRAGPETIERAALTNRVRPMLPHW